MGDKNPKTMHKQAAQKQTKADNTKQKKEGMQAPGKGESPTPKK